MKTIKAIKITVLIFGISTLLYSCASSEDASYSKLESKNIALKKSGAQLWGENCIRCHNTPSPASYNDTDWGTIGLHMRIRANLTDVEAKKIFEFLKSAN